MYLITCLALKMPHFLSIYLIYLNTLVNPFCLTFLAKIDVSGSAVSSESKASDSLSNYSSHTSILLKVWGHTPRIDQSFYCELRVVGFLDFV